MQGLFSNILIRVYHSSKLTSFCEDYRGVWNKTEGKFLYFTAKLIYSIVLMIIIIHVLLQIYLLIPSFLFLRITTVFVRSGSSAHYGRLKLN